MPSPWDTYFSDSWSALKRMPRGLLDIVTDVVTRPEKAARGLLGPALPAVLAAPQFTVAGDVEAMVYDAGQIMPNLKAGNYKNAALHGILAPTSLAMMAWPGTVAPMRSAMGLPSPKGAAPDRTEYSLVRHMAPKGDSARIQRLMTRYHEHPELADDMRRIVRAGEDVGREWYNTEDLRDMFIKELGKKEGDKAWREYIMLVGATSTGSKVEPNLRNASYYFTENAPGHNGGPGALAYKTDELIAGDMLPPKGSGYGHKMQKNQAKNVGNYYSGNWGATADPKLNPKPRGFAQSLLGGHQNIAADKHFMRLMSMMSDDPAFLHGSAEISKETLEKLRDRFGDAVEPFLSERTVNGKPAYNFNAKAAVLGKKGSKKVKAADPVEGMFDFIKDEKIKSAWDDMPADNEYKAFEGFVNELAKEMGMTGPQLQAAFWMGAAADTGVDLGSQRTFMEIFNDILAKRAEERGLTKKQVFKNFARRAQPLAVPVGAVGLAGLLGSDEE